MADVWKENILKDLEGDLLESETVGEFLANIKKEFRREDKETKREMNRTVYQRLIKAE